MDISLIIIIGEAAEITLAFPSVRINLAGLTQNAAILSMFKFIGLKLLKNIYISMGRNNL